ncbi:Fe-S oxidoreductase [Candidatus Scalindua japonica]|uniref:Fe-S oxidoreductase n=1 Tax=Candidatus Scalindua japonica TaxID=1284222 RepID=A0A286TWU4_9BACT|nr:radical SAM protein [Candidatus Scalindua japonica]GAX60353.1 Fe-S oxidoreductase [Candidatus Scalindua japonica]
MITMKSILHSLSSFCLPGKVLTSPLDKPERMHLNLTSACNIHCIICRWGDKKSYPKGVFLSKDVIDKLITETFDSLRELRIDSAGENLLSSHFAHVLSEATKRNVPIFISTNGTILNERNAEVICNSSVKNMQISIDSPVKETLELLRSGAGYENVIKGAETIVKARRKTDNNKKPHIDFHAALFKSNLEQVPDLLRLAKRTGIDGVTVAFGFIHEHMNPDWSIFWEKTRTKIVIAKSLLLSKILGIHFSAPINFLKIFGKYKSNNYCNYLFESTYIEPSGKVSPCCIGRYDLGDLNHSSFSDIWSGKRYSELRRTYNTDTPVYNKCASCYITGYWDPDDYKTYFHPSHWKYVEKKSNKIHPG